jgi:GT2 family glycosyltransferase
MGVVVVTVAHGRHEHLRCQLVGIDRSEVLPAGHVVVAVDDPGIPGLVTRTRVPTRVCRVNTGGTALPIGRARNIGASEAITAGADVIVFLDVDCIPGRRLIERYRDGAHVLPEALLSGPVAYLDPPPPGGYELSSLDGAPGHPDRPVPTDDAVVTGADHRLFWSLSFAVTAPTWRRLGGFCEQYVGYGGEDTDLGQLAAQRGIGHAWVGGAWAYHQFHPVADPPTERAVDIVRNANVFHDRWGWWPMASWLADFEARGLARLRDGRWEAMEVPSSG